MLDILFWVVVGAFVGWNVPQPFWAVWFQNWATEKWNNFTNKK